MGGVRVILILRAGQISHKGQQSLTKLNAKQAAYMSGSFPSLKMFGLVGIQALSYRNTSCSIFMCFNRYNNSNRAF